MWATNKCYSYPVSPAAQDIFSFDSRRTIRPPASEIICQFSWTWTHGFQPQLQFNLMKLLVTGRSCFIYWFKFPQNFTYSRENPWYFQRSSRQSLEIQKNGNQRSLPSRKWVEALPDNEINGEWELLPQKRTSFTQLPEYYSQVLYLVWWMEITLWMNEFTDM
jgi:hypothetical protein